MSRRALPIFAFQNGEMSRPQSGQGQRGRARWSYSIYTGCGKWSKVIGIASEKEGVNVESDRISFTGDFPMISSTVSRVSSDNFVSPVRGKLRGPKSAFWMRIE